MGYVIIEVRKAFIESDGDILLVKANPVKETMSAFSRIFGKRYHQFSITESDETETFLFPFSEENAQYYVQIANQSQKDGNFWEPFETGEFVEDTVYNDGVKTTVYRSVDTIPEVTIGEDWIGWEEDDYWENDNYFEYSEDMFDVNPLDQDNEAIPMEDNVDETQNTTEPSIDISIFQKYSTTRYSEEEIKKMSVHEKHDERSLCAKAKNIDALLDFYTYDFKHGCAAMNEYVIPAISYLYGRTNDVDTLNNLIKEYSYCLWDLSDDSREAATKLVGIGVAFPHLSASQIDYLEHLYNSPKYCETMDEILCDKEKLPRKISGITKEQLKKTNDYFSEKLLQQIFNSFVLNRKAQSEYDNEYTEYYVYVRRHNNIIKKEYGKVGSGECVIFGSLDLKSFIDYVKPKYGEGCSTFFLQHILKRRPWFNDINELSSVSCEWIYWNELFDIAKEFFLEDTEILNKIKLDIALLYLKQLNKQ
mgnify:CR=1 FL=1